MALLGLAASVMAGAAGAQQPHEGQGDVCDSTLPRVHSRPDGYRERGDRCEGVYAELPVGGATLRKIASLTAGEMRYDLGNGRPLTITWPSGLDGPVRLRATALQTNVYYQMDTLRPAEPAAFEWPSGFLIAERIEPRDLGVVGWTTVPIGGEDRPVYLPLSVRQGGGTAAAEANRRYQLVVVPGAELRELYLVVDRINDDGMVVETVLPRTPLRYGLYPAERGIPLTLPDLRAPGTYRVALTGERQSDGLKSTKEFLLYHPAAA